MRTLPALLLAFLVGCVASAAPPSSSSGGGGGGASSGSTITADETLAGCEALTPSAGDVCYPTDSLYVLVSRSDGTWVNTIPGAYGDLTKPPTSGWTAYNSGSVAASGGIRTLTMPAEACCAGGYRGEYRAQPSDPTSTAYYVEMLVGVDWCADNGVGGRAAGFSDGTALAIMNASCGEIATTRRSSATAFVGTDSTVDAHPTSTWFWIRLEEDATERRFYTRNAGGGGWVEWDDGVGRTTTLTADSIWWGSIGLDTEATHRVYLASYATGSL